MKFEHSIFLALGVIFLGAALASGPLVSGIDLTPQNPTSIPPGNGTIEVESIHVEEEQFRVVPNTSSNNSGGYVLLAPDVTVDLGEVTGRPVLEVKMKLWDLSLWDLRTQILSKESAGGQRVIEGEMTSVPDGVRTNETYRGRVIVRTVSDVGERVLYNETIEVEFEGER